ncbi:hypothetical protein CC80DRAFT_388505, partial [Byssothecium circinans]
DRIIKLAVGPNKTLLNIHEKILYSSSDFFKKALKPSRTSPYPEPDTVELPTDTVETVELYTNWLYFKNIPASRKAHWFLRNHKVSEFTALVQAFVFGEKVMDSQFKEAVLFNIEKIVTRDNSKFPSAEDMAVLYKGTPEGSPARHLMATFCANRAGADASLDFASYPHEFLVDALGATLRIRNPPEGSSWVSDVR